MLIHRESRIVQTNSQRRVNISRWPNKVSDIIPTQSSFFESESIESLVKLFLVTTARGRYWSLHERSYLVSQARRDLFDKVLSESYPVVRGPRYGND
jgi:hypothetical protein